MENNQLPGLAHCQAGGMFHASEQRIEARRQFKNEPKPNIPGSNSSFPFHSGASKRRVGVGVFCVMTYSQKLKDPRWQRKRLEVLSRDEFTCRICKSTENTLHVHHIRYIKGREPWEYREFYFVTLCQHCHETEENELKKSVMKMRLKPAETPRVVNLPELPPWEVDVENNKPDKEDLEQFFLSLKGLIEQP
jgi:5-methylcytosine-specific restriction endonuclease McrA